MAIEDFYEVLDHHNAGGVQVLNVYHVERDSGIITSALIAEAFEDSILTPLLLLQDDRIQHTEIAVRNLGDPTDFNSRAPVPNLGTRITGAGFAQFYAAAIQFNRTRTDMKHGQKRFFAGVEPDQEDGTWNGGFLTALESIRDPLLTDWERASAPAVPVCRYVILQRVCVVPGQEPCLKYRLPDVTDEPIVKYTPVTAIIRDRVRSQVSRKKLI